MPSSTAPSINAIILDKVNQIDRAINGNGHEGMSNRLTRMEEVVRNACDICEVNSESISTLNAAMIALTNSVDNHHKKDHLSELMRKKGFWFMIFGGYFILHEAITYSPAAWAWISKVAGY